MDYIIQDQWVGTIQSLSSQTLSCNAVIGNNFYFGFSDSEHESRNRPHPPPSTSRQPPSPTHSTQDPRSTDAGTRPEPQSSGNEQPELPSLDEDTDAQFSAPCERNAGFGMYCIQECIFFYKTQNCANTKKYTNPGRGILTFKLTTSSSLAMYAFDYVKNQVLTFLGLNKNEKKKKNMVKP